MRDSRDLRRHILQSSSKCLTLKTWKTECGLDWSFISPASLHRVRASRTSQQRQTTSARDLWPNDIARTGVSDLQHSHKEIDPPATRLEVFPRAVERNEIFPRSNHLRFLSQLHYNSISADAMTQCCTVCCDVSAVKSDVIRSTQFSIHIYLRQRVIYQTPSNISRYRLWLHFSEIIVSFSIPFDLTASLTVTFTLEPSSKLS